MTTYAHAVTARRSRTDQAEHHEWTCGGCGVTGWPSDTLSRAADRARIHAASCEALHRANLTAYCPSCALYGRVSPVCPKCLGHGWAPKGITP